MMTMSVILLVTTLCSIVRAPRLVKISILNRLINLTKSSSLSTNSKVFMAILALRSARRRKTALLAIELLRFYIVDFVDPSSFFPSLFLSREATMVDLRAIVEKGVMKI